MIRSNANALIHEAGGSEYALALLWWLASAALLVSLWLVGDANEPGAIYLRAACIMYLGLTFIQTNEVSRAIRLAVGTVLLILSVAAVSLTATNAPLYVSTVLCALHIILSILTYTGGTMVLITGIRGLAFMMIGLFISTVAVVVSYYDDMEDVPRAIVFASAGIPTAIMANGIPVRERDQVIGSFATLASVATCMYCMGSLSTMEPWIIGAAGVIGGVSSALLCVTRDSVWRNNLLHMLKFAISSRTMAMFLIVLFTFGNIACINGVARGVEDEWCPAYRINISGVAYSAAEKEYIYKISQGGRPDLCIPGATENLQLKGIEETIPLLMMGLTKGALAVVVLIGNLSDFAETSAWAMSSVLGTASVFMVAIEGRGRCFGADTSTCDVYRSPGFTSGLIICGVATILCWFRLLIAGLWVPYVDRVAQEALAKALYEDIDEAPSTRDRVVSMFKSRLSKREIGKAVAVTALLICLIATSTANVHPDGLPEVNNETTWGEIDEYTTAGIQALYPNYNSSVSRCSPFCDELIPSNAVVLYNRQMVARAESLAEYWSSTCYIIAASVLVLSIISIETVPISPAAGIALMAALLVTAGRVHYGCLISSMNLRLFNQGVSMIANVYLDVYIMGVISIVIGLAWGEATLRTRPKPDDMVQRRQTTEKAIMLTIGNRDPQAYKETFEVLNAAGAVKALVEANMMHHFSNNGPEPSAENTAWGLLGAPSLANGAYLMNMSYKDLAEVAKSCAAGTGHLQLVRRMEASHVEMNEMKATDEDEPLD